MIKNETATWFCDEKASQRQLERFECNHGVSVDLLKRSFLYSDIYSDMCSGLQKGSMWVKVDSVKFLSNVYLPAR